MDSRVFKLDGVQNPNAQRLGVKNPSFVCFDSPAKGAAPAKIAEFVTYDAEKNSGYHPCWGLVVRLGL